MEKEKQHIVVQRFKKLEKDSLSSAYRYYSILSAVNNLRLTEREIQLIAFIAIKGNISYINNREEFCRLYQSSAPTINNIVSKLRKQGILVKEASKIKIHPAITIDFSKEVVLQVRLGIDSPIEEHGTDI